MKAGFLADASLAVVPPRSCHCRSRSPPAGHPPTVRVRRVIAPPGGADARGAPTPGGRRGRLEVSQGAVVVAKRDHLLRIAVPGEPDRAAVSGSGADRDLLRPRAVTVGGALLARPL